MRFALFFAAMAAFAGTPKVAADTAVVVLVDGHGSLPGGVWYGVRSLVSSMFERINVQLAWQNGTPSVESSPDRIAIAMRIAAREPGAAAVREPTCSSPAAFACSFPYDLVRPRIIVMYERVRFYTRRPRLFQPLLAHTIAHEIAHILAARETHSEAGIMKEHWTSADFDRMEIAALEFTASDVDSIQEGFNLRRRQ